MISYCHDNNAFCDHVINRLRSERDSYDVWIDRTHCQGTDDLWELIAGGIEGASLVVCLLSPQYFESKSCRQEFVYAADKRKKKLVPILLDKFEPAGWLGECCTCPSPSLFTSAGIRMTGLKYVRFKDIERPEQKKMDELCTTILTSLSLTKETTHRDEIPLKMIPAPATPPRQRSFAQWTSSSDDIHAWFADHHISSELRDLFNFQSTKEMLAYAPLVVTDREQQLSIYTRLFARKYSGNDLPPNEFYRLALALEQLLDEHRSVAVQSKTCSIS